MKLESCGLLQIYIIVVREAEIERTKVKTFYSKGLKSHFSFRKKLSENSVREKCQSRGNFLCHKCT